MYSSTQKGWEQAIKSDLCKDNVQWCTDKVYPEMYNCLGWCTWQSFGVNNKFPNSW